MNATEPNAELIEALETLTRYFPNSLIEVSQNADSYRAAEGCGPTVTWSASVQTKATGFIGSGHRAETVSKLADEILSQSFQHDDKQKELAKQAATFGMKLVPA